ncbi:MAG: 5'-methylthioadenosine/adenosylhomocysteine nucleosidase [Candidatus Izimaplasma sp.]|nr:5'-methylthioadenosine/adenosylhomocysteine nucleosidase [Candidatus Izimaplasma bacterium]
MIGIIGALNEELEVILKDVTDIKEIKLKVRTFYTGKIYNKDVVIVLAGIGKVNAAITTSLLIENFDVKYIINIGVAGGLNGVKHKDVVVSREVLYHDVDVVSIGKYVRGQMPGSDALFYADENLLNKTKMILKNLHIDFKIGKVASGDQFIYSLDTVAEVNKLYSDIYAVEMEAAAIAHTATLYKIPFIVYRSISDIIDNKNQDEDFYQFLGEASYNASLVLKELIKIL